jgi:hypothetical protein
MENDRRADAGLAGLIGLLVVQVIIGYEWLVSGVTKLWRGGFAVGLGAELREKSKGVAAWYRPLLRDAVIPHAWAVGWAVLVAEVLVGVALLVAAGVWLSSIRQGIVRSSTRRAAGVAAAAGIVAIAMNIAFHLANGAPHPWLIPKEGFDEGVDLDSLMPLIELVLVLVNVRLASVGRDVAGAAPAAS